MPGSRREFMAGSVAASLLLSSPQTFATSKPRFKAIAFDAFALFDPRPVYALVEKLFPGKGAELSSTWRTRQFEYTWLRVVSKRYADFWTVTEDALVFAAKMLQMELPAEKRKPLMAAYLELKLWPDALPALRTLKEADIRLALLSNFTPRMLEAAVKSSSVEGVFEHLLSTDKVRTYKPDPLAYRMGIEAFKLRREEILFVAYGGWDAAGAKSFGYPTFWANRLNAPVEELGTAPDAIGNTLDDLVRFVML